MGRMKLRLALLFVLVALAPLLASAIRSAPPALLPARTVILVRHAEKATDDPRDPSLSEAGVARARALARLLAHARPARLVASEYKRTQATLAPLAAALGKTVEVVAASDTAALARTLAAEAPGTTVVVAGHSNTLPALAAELGAPLHDVQTTPKGPQLGDDEYDRVFVLTLPPSDSGVAPSVLELRYGEAAPAAQPPASKPG
jgi:phosphohistidine phosphatase SixA